MLKYYAHIENGILVGKGQLIIDNTLCVEITKEVYDNIEQYIYQNGEIILDPEYNHKQEIKLIIQEVEDLKMQLDQIDLKSIRAIRANDTEYIEKYESEAQALRNRIRELENRING